MQPLFIRREPPKSWVKALRAGAQPTQDWNTITHLDLRRHAIDHRALERLVGSPHITALTSLDLTRTNIGLRGLRTIAHSPLAPRLTHLVLQHCKIHGKALRALFTGPPLAQLQTLDLRNNPIGKEGTQALLSATTHLPILQQLHVTPEMMGPHNLWALYDAPHFGKLFGNPNTQTLDTPPLEALRAILYEPPTPETWSKLTKTLGRCPQPMQTQVALPYILEHVQTWPSRLREMPWNWLVQHAWGHTRLLPDTAPLALAQCWDLDRLRPLCGYLSQHILPHQVFAQTLQSAHVSPPKHLLGLDPKMLKILLKAPPSITQDIEEISIQGHPTWSKEPWNANHSLCHDLMSHPIGRKLRTLQMSLMEIRGAHQLWPTPQDATDALNLESLSLRLYLCGEQARTALQQSLQSCHKLHTLKLQFSTVPRDTPHDLTWATLFELWTRLPLTHMHITNLPIDQVSLQHFAAQHHPISLEDLTLQQCQLDQTAILTLARALPLQNLKSLTVYQSRMEPELQTLLNNHFGDRLTLTHDGTLRR